MGLDPTARHEEPGSEGVMGLAHCVNTGYALFVLQNRD